MECVYENVRSEFPQALPWMVLATSIMNTSARRSTVKRCTSRFFARWPQPDLVAIAEDAEVMHYVQALGMHRRRTEALIGMSVLYAQALFANVAELPGIGAQGIAAWSIYVEGVVPALQPVNPDLFAVWCALGGIPEVENAQTISGSQNMATFCSVSKPTILKAIHRGEINARRVGGSRGFVSSKRELLRWTENR